MTLKQFALGMLLMLLWLSACTPTATEPAVEPTATTQTGGALSVVSTEEPDESAVTFTESDADESAAEKINFDMTIVYTKEGRFPGSPQEWTFYGDGRVINGEGQEWQLSNTEIETLFAATPVQDGRDTTTEYGVENCLDCLVHTVTLASTDQSTQIVYNQGRDGWPAELEPLFTNITRLIEAIEQ